MGSFFVFMISFKNILKIDLNAVRRVIILELIIIANLIGFCAK
jgi:hypothetical protein